MSNFEELGVRARTAATLQSLQITTPNPVQEQAIPPLLEGRDVVIEAPTGSGKTLAFALPLIERLSRRTGIGPRALVVTPTRELATQISTVITQVEPSLRQVLAIGGVGYGQQLSGLRNRPDVIVGCPGRILDLVERGALMLLRTEYVVLDEADEMFDQGFADDVERILGLCAKTTGMVQRQTVLASATMPAWVQRLISKHLLDPARVQMAGSNEPDLEHALLEVTQEGKIATLDSLLKHQQRAELTQTIVFHRTRYGAEKLARDLRRRGHTTVELQGNLTQSARDRALETFRNGECEVLVATNVAARGLDVVNVGLVVNYDLPETPQWLTHRIGRTARNGAAGKAITFLSELDGEKWRKLRLLGAPALPALDPEAFAVGEWKLKAGPVESDKPAVVSLGRRRGGRRPWRVAPRRRSA